MKTFRKKFGQFTCVARLKKVDGVDALVFEWDPFPGRGELSLDAYKHWRDTVVVPAVMKQLGQKRALVVDL